MSRLRVGVFAWVVLVLGVHPAVGEAQRRPATPPADAPAPAEPAPAEVDDDDLDARQHFEAGLAYYARARYADAAREFQESYDLSHRPALLINLATALERDGRPAEALAASQRYLEVAPTDAPERPGEEGRIARLQAELEHRSTEEGEETPDTVPEPPDAEADFSSPNDELRITAWAALGAAVIFEGVALGMGLRSHAIHGDLEDACPSGLCDPMYGADIDKGRRFGKISTITSFLGAGFAVTGLIVWLVSRGGDDEEEPATTAAIDVGRDHAVVTWRRRF